MDNQDNRSTGNPPGFKSWEDSSSWFDKRSEQLASGIIPEVSAEQERRQAMGKRTVTDDRLPFSPSNRPRRNATVHPLNGQRQEPYDDYADTMPGMEGEGTDAALAGNGQRQTVAAQHPNKRQMHDPQVKKKRSGKLVSLKRRKPARSKDDERAEAAKEKKKKKKLSRWVKASAGMVMGLFILFMLFLFIFCKTQTIIVEGECRYSDEEIITASGITVDDYVWHIDKDHVNDFVGRICPYVGNVKISVKLPSTVRVIITQAVEKYAVRVSKNYTVISDTGKVLSRTEKKIPKGAIELIGVSIAESPVGEQVSVSEDSKERMKSADELIDKAQQQGIAPITAVNVENESAVYLLYAGRIKLYFGNLGDLSAKMKKAAGLVELLNEENKNVTGVANLSVNGKVYFLQGSIDAQVTSSERYEVEQTLKKTEKEKSKQKKNTE